MSTPSSFKIFTNPTFFEVVQGVTVKLNEAGYHTLLSIVDLENEAITALHITRSSLADAMIIIDTRSSDDQLTKILDEICIPTIVTLRNSPTEKVFSVTENNQKCGYLATKHLIEAGHRTIGFIGLLPGVVLAEQRLAGYKQALKEHDLPYNAALVINGNHYQESGALGIRQLLKQSPTRPTAVFASNDLMALGVIEALEQEGFRVPEDISVIGCDNIPNLHLFKIPLTTVSVPFYEIGRLAAEKAINILQGKKDTPSQIVLEPDLRIRASVKQIINE
jgi:DNA-binding LacI/PurR family transcriptional regulator